MAPQLSVSGGEKEIDSSGVNSVDKTERAVAALLKPAELHLLLNEILCVSLSAPLTSWTNFF